ncbi:MAG: RNA methyltransferase [Anaerolineae bacterium]|nr:RNA methyltransferase [Anaerolineae bacterium]
MITSLYNTQIKSVVKLRRPQERNRLGKTIIEGYRGLRCAIDSGYPVEMIYFCPALFLGENEFALIRRAQTAGVRAIEVAEAPFRRMASRDRPEGLIAVARQRRASLPARAPHVDGFYGIVEAIQSPGNLGAIFRSADAARVDGVIVCDPCTDSFGPEAIRASVGTAFALPVWEACTEEAIAWCRAQGIRIVAATPHADALYTDVDMRGALAIALGAEQYGLSAKWLDAADARVRIPQFGQADSLNVAVAATLLFYEVVRQRGLALPTN